MITLGTKLRVGSEFVRNSCGESRARYQNMVPVCITNAKCFCEDWQLF